MADPITKIWLFELKPGKSVDSVEFQTLWQEILQHCASYTADQEPEQHTVYQGVENSSQLAMVTGYPTLELNLEADRIYAATFMSRMFDMVTHQQLFLLHVDVNALPLASGQITVSKIGEEPEESQPGKGGWDHYKSPQTADTENASPPARTWIQVSATQDGTTEPKVGESWKLRKIMGK